LAGAVLRSDDDIDTICSTCGHALEFHVSSSEPVRRVREQDGVFCTFDDARIKAGCTCRGFELSAARRVRRADDSATDTTPMCATCLHRRDLHRAGERRTSGDIICHFGDRSDRVECPCPGFDSRGDFINGDASETPFS
jgi:hypothetical protein